MQCTCNANFFLSYAFAMQISICYYIYYLYSNYINKERNIKRKKNVEFMEKLKSFFEGDVEFVEIRNVDFYCKTDFWPFMPERMFHELELSETNGVFRGELIVSKVLKEDFDRMIADHDAFGLQMQCN